MQEPGKKEGGRRRESSALTSRSLAELLPHVLKGIGAVHQERPDLVLAAWPEIVGAQLAPMTQAVAFVDGFLTVIVKNSTLLSLLAQHDKPRLIKSMREKFPKTTIKTIIFRLG